MPEAQEDGDSDPKEIGGPTREQRSTQASERDGTLSPKRRRYQCKGRRPNIDERPNERAKRDQNRPAIIRLPRKAMNERQKESQWN